MLKGTVQQAKEKKNNSKKNESDLNAKITLLGKHVKLLKRQAILIAFFKVCNLVPKFNSLDVDVPLR